MGFLMGLELDLKSSLILHAAYVCALWALRHCSHSLFLFVLKLSVNLGFPELVYSSIS